jgi:hypothetical protein
MLAAVRTMHTYAQELLPAVCRSWEVDSASGGRRMLSNRDRSGVGSLDATLAAADAISKAVKTPSMGSAKFATDAGIKTQRVGGMAHTG